MKKCTRCEREKETEEFPTDRRRKDGRYPYCKKCIREIYEENKKNNPEKIKRWRKSYNDRHRMKIVDYRVKYYGENREEILKKRREKYEKRKEEIALYRAKKRRTEEARVKAREHGKRSREKTGNAYKYAKKTREKNPHKAAVHSFMVWAVKVGVLKRRENCEKCEKVCKTQGHHEDYSKPMEVNWLCSVCHGELHRRIP